MRGLAATQASHPQARGQGCITFYARMSVTSLVRSEIFNHLLNQYLWMPTKEKFFENVRNTTHGKECYVNQESREMFLTVPARFFIVLIVSKFAERWLRNKKGAMCWSLGDCSRWSVNDLLYLNSTLTYIHIHKTLLMCLGMSGRWG